MNRNFRFRKHVSEQERSREIVNYDDVTMQIQCIWDIKTKVIPIMIGTSRTLLE